MDETQEIGRAPVLTKKELQRWQKSLLEVFGPLRSDSRGLNVPTASFT